MAKQRGCGTRSAGGLYAVCATSPCGRPLEEFVIDPPIPWDAGPFQGIQLREREDGSGIWDLIDWVGATHYPTVPDFVEEGRHMGFSTKIPVNKNLDYGLLEPYASRMIYVHTRVFPLCSYELQPHEDGDLYVPKPPTDGPWTCKHPTRYQIGEPGRPCTFALWQLSSLTECPPQHGNYDGPDEFGSTIKTPSTEYSVLNPALPGWDEEPEYRPGIFLWVPLQRFEFIGDVLTEEAAGVLGDHAETNTLLCED